MPTIEYRFIKSRDGWFPADAVAEEWAAKKPDRYDVLVTAKKPRNGRQHSLYWVLCTLIANNRENWNPEDVSNFFKIATGHVRRVMDAHGNEYKFPKSINFASMDQDEFSTFFQRCVDLVTERIIPGLPESDLRRELESMVSR